MNLNYWAPGPMHVSHFGLQIVVSGAPMLACAFIGMGIGVVHKRWGPNGLWALLIGAMVLFDGLAILVTWLRAWGDIGDWFGNVHLAALAVGLPAAFAVIVDGLSFLGLRRVVP